jgi:AcrR family transcriptional regulator
MAVGHVNANDPRVKRTRQLLQQTLIELMGEKRFSAITVQDLAERSTLNRATFYAHFEDKYHLLDSIMREGFERVLSGTVPDGAPLTGENLRLVCQALLTFLAQMQDHCKPIDRQLEPMMEKAAQDVLQTFFLQRLRPVPAASRSPIPMETAASVLSWAIFGVSSEWSRGPRAESAEEVAARVVALLTEGLAASFLVS